METESGLNDILALWWADGLRDKLGCLTSVITGSFCETNLRNFPSVIIYDESARFFDSLQSGNPGFLHYSITYFNCDFIIFLCFCKPFWVPPDRRSGYKSCKEINVDWEHVLWCHFPLEKNLQVPGWPILGRLPRLNRLHGSLKCWYPFNARIPILTASYAS